MTNLQYIKMLNRIIKQLKREQQKYEWDDYEFPIPRVKIASYHAFGRAIGIVQEEMEKYNDTSS